MGLNHFSDKLTSELASEMLMSSDHFNVRKTNVHKRKKGGIQYRLTTALI